MPVRMASNSNVQEYDLAGILGVKPRRLAKLLLKKPGDKVKKGETIAVRKGLKSRLFVSPSEGEIVSLADDGTLKIASTSTPPPPRGKKARPSASDLPVTQGYGGQSGGTLVFFEEEVTVFDLQEDLQEKVIAFPGKLSQGLWYKSLSLGVKGVICSEAPDEGLKAGVTKQLLWLDGEAGEEEVPLLIIEAGDDQWDLLKKQRGKPVKIDGAAKQLTFSTATEK